MLLSNDSQRKGAFVPSRSECPSKMLQGSEINYCQELESAELMVAKRQRLCRTIIVSSTLHMKVNTEQNEQSLSIDTQQNNQNNRDGSTIISHAIEMRLRLIRISSITVKNGNRIVK